MSSDTIRGVKAVLKTALTWGLGLGIFAGTLISVYVLFNAGPGVESLPERIGEALFAGVAMGTRFALAGFIMGTLFASLVRFSFRGRRVADLNPWKFGLIGALVGGVGIPLVYQLLNVISGGPIPWNLLYDDSIWASVVGGVGAAGTVWMARRAAALPAEREAGVLGDGSRVEANSAFTEEAKDRTTV